MMGYNRVYPHTVRTLARINATDRDRGGNKVVFKPKEIPKTSESTRSLTNDNALSDGLQETTDSVPANDTEVQAYCKVEMGGHTYQTKPDTVRGLNPKWDESHHNELRVKYKSTYQPEFRLTIWDDDVWEDDFIGEVVVDCNPFLRQPNHLTVEQFKIYCNGSPAGLIRLAMKYEPHEVDHDRGEMVVVCLKAFGLKDPDVPEVANALQDHSLIIGSVIAILSYLGVGCVAYSKLEDFTFVEGLYFGVVTLTTVGYGDILPTKDGTKLFTCVFIVLGIMMISAAMGFVASFVIERSNERLKTMMKHQRENTADQLNNRGRNKLLVNGLTFLMIEAIGVFGFMYFEDLSVVDAIYGSTVTVTTVGYGEISFESDEGHVFGIFYLLIGVVLTAKMMGDVADVFLESKQREVAKQILERELDENLLDELDEDGSGQVTELEFLRKMLVKLNKCAVEDINTILDQFKALDADNSGVLSREDITRARRRIPTSLNLTMSSSNLSLANEH